MIAADGWGRGTGRCRRQRIVVICPVVSTLRTRRLLVSAMYMFPALSNTTRTRAVQRRLSRRPAVSAKAGAAGSCYGGNSSAFFKTRIRLLAWSAKYTLPEASSKTV